MLTAKTYLRRASRGRSAPPLCLCEGPSGEIFRAYLKSPALHPELQLNCLEREWMASHLAKALSLPAATVWPVLLERSFLDALPDEDGLRERLISGPEVVIASIDAGDGWRLFNNRANLPRSALDLAISIITFDALTENWDRCPRNSNLLQSGDRLLMIDHEEAFYSAAANERITRPWVLERMDQFGAGNTQHCLVSKLSPKSRCDFHAAGQAWRNLPDCGLKEYIGSAPDAWDRPVLDRIEAYIYEAREHADVFCGLANQIVHQ